MEYELKLPAEEILDYVKTRKEFETRLKERLNLSQRYIQVIRKAIENEQGRGRR